MESITVHISQELIDEALKDTNTNGLWSCRCPVAKELSRIFGRLVSVNGCQWFPGDNHSGYTLPGLVRFFIGKIDDAHYHWAPADMSVLKPFSFELELPPGLKPVVAP